MAYDSLSIIVQTQLSMFEELIGLSMLQLVVTLLQLAVAGMKPDLISKGSSSSL